MKKHKVLFVKFESLIFFFSIYFHNYVTNMEYSEHSFDLDPLDKSILVL